MAAAPEMEITLYVHYHTPIGVDEASFMVTVPADENVTVVTLTSDILKNIPVDGYIFKYWMDGPHYQESTIYSVNQIIEIPSNDLHLYGIYEPIVKQKNIKARYQQKHDIEANWLKATNFIPMQGEIIVYDVDSNYTYERFKIGDGKTLVSDLPFTYDALASDISAVNNKVTNIEPYLLNIDYDAILAFDTSEVIFGASTSSVLGQAILGQMILALN